jgi:AcrR family transcriptional regulator
MAVAAEQTHVMIMNAAEAHFRRYGYAKTTVADIAKACGMSPANVYRFFDSKAAIVDAIADLWLGETVRAAKAIAARDASATGRLEAYVVDVHRMLSEQHTNDSSVHELCSVVIAERRPVVQQYKNAMSAILAEILEDGRARGEFAFADAGETAAVLADALIKFHHPNLVAEYHGEPLEDHARRMARLLIRAIAA